MKTTERHDLKHNEVADTLQGAYLQLERNRKTIAAVAGGVLAVAAIWGGYSYFAAQKEAKAGALLAQALVDRRGPGRARPSRRRPDRRRPPPRQARYPTEAAKLDATVPKYLAAADAYPGTQAGISARYHAAAALTAQGKPADARTQYEAVIAADGRGLYGRMARLGLAELDVKAGKFDPAIATLRELSLDARGDLPVDAVLVQLAQAYVAAGKKTEAQQALARVTTEFATSPYASDAKKLLETIKPGA